MKITLTQFFTPLARAARPGGRLPHSGSEPPSDPKRDKPAWARRVADAGCRRFTNTTHHATSVAAWAGVLFLLLCGSVTDVRAQLVISDPNQIVGTIKWINDPAGPVYGYLNSAAPPHGLGSGPLYARQVGGGFSAGTFVPDDASHISVPYSITVQAGITPGIQYDVTPRMTLEDNRVYYFATATSSGVLPEPAPDVVLDFAECAGLIEVQFCDSANNPVTVQSGSFYAYVQPFGPEAIQAHGGWGSVSSARFAVRGGNTFSVDVNIDETSGTDAFLDYFSITYSANYTVTVGCDEIVTIKFIVPPSLIGSGSALGKIVGNVDMLGESEHWIDGVFTLMRADDGPLGNYRYDSVEPASLGGPSSGPFALVNLLPSNFSVPARDYRVRGELSFGSNRRYEFFQTPWLDRDNGRVTVPPGATVDLGDTFVINPGYVVGDIFLCGPDEEGRANSLLRHIYRGSDSDSNGDGIPDDFTDLRGSSRVIADGLDLLGAGATRTARGGYAQALFEGDFVVSGPDKNHFVGDYRLTLGGLLQETTRWNPQGLVLFFSNTATPADRDTYIDLYVQIVDLPFANQEIVPGQTLRNDHRYGFSQVTVRFRATSGTLFRPAVWGGGSFNGVNFEGQPAQYQSSVYPAATGTPIDLATAATSGQVVLCIPEGTYTFHPTVFSVNPDGVSYSHNTLPPVNVTVGACEFIEITPGLVLNVNTIPECVAQPELALSGSVSSAAAVASITYTLNGNTVTVCNNCGLSPSFNFSITLADCDNTLKITATDVNGLVSSRSKTIHFDDTPPVLSACQNRTVDIQPGELGAVVDFTVTATDNCDGTVPVTCDPSSGSFFLEGATPVTCRATDQCGNTSTCTFTVTVTGVDRTPPTIHCPGDILTATDPGRCSAVVTFTATASDNRPGVTYACSPASGSAFSKGTTTVTCTATDAAGNTANCSFTVTVQDREAPVAKCRPTTNPAGNQIPPAGNNPKSGHNPDGFYQLLATDNCDAAASLQIFVKDSAQGLCGGAFVAGPYRPGDKVKLTQSPGQASVRPMAREIVAHINTLSDPVLVVTDSSGNTSFCHNCLVPPPPK